MHPTIHSHNTRQRDNPHSHQIRTLVARNSIVHRAPQIWSDIPKEIRKINTRNSFKRALKQSFLSGYWLPHYIEAPLLVVWLLSVASMPNQVSSLYNMYARVCPHVYMYVHLCRLCIYVYVYVHVYMWMLRANYQPALVQLTYARWARSLWSCAVPYCALRHHVIWLRIADDYWLFVSWCCVLCSIVIP